MNLAQLLLCYNYSFLILSPGMVNRTLSHICGRLYLPVFQFRVGLFTLMYMASLMVLAMLFSSLPIIWKFSIDVLWLLLFWCPKIGDGAFKCSLYLSPNVLADPPMYSSSQTDTESIWRHHLQFLDTKIAAATKHQWKTYKL